MEAVCRTCLSVSAATESLSTEITIEKNDKLTLSKMISLCTGLEISIYDNFTNFICKSCVNLLINAFEYRKQCWKSHTKLQEQANKKNEQTSSEQCESSKKIPTMNTSLTEIDAIGHKDFEMLNPSDVDDFVFSDWNDTESSEDSDEKLNHEENDEELKNSPMFEELKKHMHMEYDKTIKATQFTCRICKKQQFHRVTAIQHIEQAHKIYLLELKTSPMYEDLNKHMEMVYDETTNATRFTCRLCKKQQLHRVTAIKHIEQAHKIYLLKLPERKKKVLVISKTNTTVTPDMYKPRINICEYCGKEIVPAYLDSHIKTHTGEKPFKCQMCDYSSIRKSALDRHIRTHLSIKPYACKTCGHAFSDSGSLNSHNQIHLPTKTFQCRKCSKLFRTRKVLSNHMRKSCPFRI